MAIMVDGVFKCIGSTQHIKNRFGKGYELELKLAQPTAPESLALLATLQLDADAALSRAEVNEALRAAGSEHLIGEIDSQGLGAALATDLQHAQGRVSARILVEFIISNDYASRVVAFAEQSFGAVEVAEQLQTFLRLRIERLESLGSTFTLLEQNKHRLRIQDYSLKQTSLEQIFHSFSTRRRAPQAGDARAPRPQSQIN
eukprot:TRINITY_DN10252_c0_g2_i2.p1 TRINITY_DN10252_c0_g2~~TRINITY_DN10252_c0_g2_i2.p1  ORF type:complete len:201 (-),score=57.36 TRINITY_DN10252_c0_g2_i2:18-620(-)